MKKRIPLLSRVLLQFVLVSGVACAPRQRTVPVPFRSTKASSTPSTGKTSCGLPAELRESDWPRLLSPVSSREPEPLEEGTATIVVLPDTQYYVDCRTDHVSRQADWVRSQREQRNIRFAVQLGDLTEHNTDEEWLFVSRALAPVSQGLPFFVTTGNHDYGDDGRADVRTTGFQRYFSVPGAATRSATAATLTPGDWENAYYRVPFDGVHLGVLVLEWSPRKKAVEWAKEVLVRHSDDRVIFITHAYLYHDGTRYDWTRFGDQQKWNPRAYGTARKDPDGPSQDGNWLEEGAYDGEMLWQELLRHHPGVFLTLNGHVLGDGAAVRSDRGVHGNLVHQVLVNYQMLDEGGLGYLRLIEIAADRRQLKMKTYSPSLKLFATAPDQNFELSIEPPLR